MMLMGMFAMDRWVGVNEIGNGMNCGYALALKLSLGSKYLSADQTL